MNAALRIGTPVAVGGVEGQIATIRVVEDGLFILNLRTASGLIAVTVRRNGDDLVPAPRAPVDVADAVQVARRVVAGKEPRMPVAAVTSMLAAALVAVADGVMPTLTVPIAEAPSHE
jgi:hypothetical protein